MWQQEQQEANSTLCSTQQQNMEHMRPSILRRPLRHTSCTKESAEEQYRREQVGGRELGAVLLLSLLQPRDCVSACVWCLGDDLVNISSHGQQAMAAAC